jgi:hypothetical protein
LFYPIFLVNLKEGFDFNINNINNINQSSDALSLSKNNTDNIKLLQEKIEKAKDLNNEVQEINVDLKSLQDKVKKYMLKKQGTATSSISKTSFEINGLS